MLIITQMWNSMKHCYEHLSLFSLFNLYPLFSCKWQKYNKQNGVEEINRQCKRSSEPCFFNKLKKGTKKNLTLCENIITDCANSPTLEHFQT